MAQAAAIVEKPTVHLVRLAVFTLVMGVIAAMLFPVIHNAFMANPRLSRFIISELFFGTV